MSRMMKLGFLSDVWCGLICVFLLAPILIIVPLSFNAEPYFSFTPAMLRLDPHAFSTRWYELVFNSPEWRRAIFNTAFIGFWATALATVLGTVAALGLSRERLPFQHFIEAVFIAPIVVPVIIFGAGAYFFYSRLGLAQSYPGLILAHGLLGAPFVVLTVRATLSGFDRNLINASASLGANSLRTFWKITVPLILPGVISGALFAFVVSFDEIVVILFLAGPEQETIPRQMWSGIREQISPAILSVAVLTIAVSMALLLSIELLRRRNARLYGGPG
jgi:putative spermidine/putrescine transport system permease protein